MKSVAVYSLKGGVGKTTLAVNLAWASAARSSRETLLWDLDPQAAATFLLECDSAGSRDACAVFERTLAPSKLIRPTAIDRLSILPADKSLRSLDHFLHELGKKKRLSRLLLDGVAGRYDRVILDCPPGLGETVEQVLRAADLILVPLIPSPLSQRALAEVIAHLDEKRIATRVLPIFNMVDRRRSLHRAVVEGRANWPAIPMASLFERSSVERMPIGLLAPAAPATRAICDLWQRIERRLAKR